MPEPAVMGILMLLASGGLFLMLKKSRVRAVLVLLFFLVAGAARMKAVTGQWQDMALVRAAGEKEVKLTGTVASIIRRPDYDVILLDRCLAETGGGSYPAGKVMVYLDSGYLDSGYPGEPEFRAAIGSRVSCFGKLEEFGESRNPGEFNYRTYYLGLKIRYRLDGEGLEPAGAGRNPYGDAVYRLRCRLVCLLDRLCGPEDAGIFQAALLGEKGNLDPEVRKLYQKNGIAHLLAISGLHISLIGAGVYRLLRRCGLGHSAAGIFSAVWIVSYGMMTGGTPSVVRAVIMLLAMMAAESVGRTYDLLSAAALAALLLLWDSPWLLFSGGVQLSFGAVFAIGLPGRWLLKHLKCANPLSEALVMGIAIQWVTYPVIRYHYFEYPIYSILLNLLVVPLMTYVVCSGAAGLLLGSFSEAAGRIALGGGHYILRFYEWICRNAEGLPGSSLILGRPELWQIGLYFGCMALFAPMAYRRREKRGRFISLLAVGGVISILMLHRIPPAGLTVIFADVGQGDGIVMEYRDLVILVDGGSSSNKRLGEASYEPLLKSRGIRKVDYAFITHGDMDHISAVRYLLEEDTGIRVENLMLPAHREGDENCVKLESLALKRGGKVCSVRRGDRLGYGELEVSCLYPGDGDLPSDINEESLVLKVRLGTFTMLLTGDMSGDGEKKLLAYGTGPVKVLKAAHHGSRFSNTEAFLERLKPEWTVISYGEGNRYGHPHQEVLERLSVVDSAVYETALSGAVTLWTDGSEVRWESWLPETRVDE